MPIYEYACSQCEATFEQLQRSMRETTAVKCRECGSAETRRVLSLFAVGAEAGPSRSAGEAPGMCGRCGGAPGSCASGM